MFEKWFVSSLFALGALSPLTALAQQAPASWSEEPDLDASGELAEVYDDPFTLTIASEFGLLSVMQNKLQQDRDGTYFDYVEEGGQELFVPFLRLSGELDWRQRHTVTLLYQPIDLRTPRSIQR